MHENKIKGFEYAMSQCLVWFDENNPGKQNDFSKLKAIKLLFFVSSANATLADPGLLNLFNNYWALPFGHVESDVYENLYTMNLFKINSELITKVNDAPYNYFEEIENYKDQVDASIKLLKRNYPELINYSAFDLVEISHQWRSWITTFEMAKHLNKKSMKIPLPLILTETKIYSL